MYRMIIHKYQNFIFSNSLQLWHIVLQYIFINSITHIFFEKIQYAFTIWWKSTPSIYLLLKIVSFFKIIITFFYPFLSSRWFKIKCSFINENNISPVSILISFSPFYSFNFYFFICFWCKLRRDIRVTIFFT